MASANDIQVLFAADLDALVDYPELVRICVNAIDADVDGRLVAPPRHSVAPPRHSVDRPSRATDSLMR